MFPIETGDIPASYVRNYQRVVVSWLVGSWVSPPLGGNLRRFKNTP